MKKKVNRVIESKRDTEGERKRSEEGQKEPRSLRHRHHYTNIQLMLE